MLLFDLNGRKKNLFKGNGITHTHTNSTHHAYVLRQRVTNLHWQAWYDIDISMGTNVKILVWQLVLPLLLWKISSKIINTHIKHSLWFHACLAVRQSLKWTSGVWPTAPFCRYVIPGLVSLVADRYTLIIPAPSNCLEVIFSMLCSWTASPGSRF